MRVIPVIDLMRGLAVRAVAGRREDYRPLVSPLADSSAPCDVAAGFLRLYPFDVFYIADLDAIMGRGDNSLALQDLVKSFPRQRFWLDAGGMDAPGASFDPVIGSETFPNEPAALDLSSRPEAILSLDFRGGAFLGPPALLASPHLWPPRIIVMTLSRVGMSAGPDIETLAAIKERAGKRDVFAAGGVRDAEDLKALARAGAAGALVASALHDGRVGRETLESFAK